jgi:hypothetical protein
MSSIPLDLERRLEQRWTARFSGPLQKYRLEEQRQLTAQSKRQRKTRRREPAGPSFSVCSLAPCPCGVDQITSADTRRDGRQLPVQQLAGVESDR